MSPEQHPKTTLTPEVAQQFADVRANCIASIATLLQEEGADVELIAGDAAIEAAEADDVTGFETHFDRLLAAPDLSLPKLANVCLAGIEAGSQRAYDMLDSIVQGEKESMRHYLETSPRAFAIDPMNAYDSGPGLANLFSSCLRTGMPPNAWIEKAALNPMHHWTLYFDFCNRILREGSPEQQAAIQSTLDKLGAELLHTERFEGEFSKFALKKIFPLLQNPELRQMLFSSLLDDLEDGLSEDPLLDFRCFASVLTDYAHGLGRQENAATYDPTLLRAHNTYNMIDDELCEDGYGVGDTCRSYIATTAAFTRYATANADDLTEGINSLVLELLEDSPESADTVYFARDRILQQHAVLAAKDGEFTWARTIISAIHADVPKYDALYECYEHANTISDLEALNSDGMWIDPSEAPEMYRLATEAGLSGDPAKIVEAMTTLAKEVPDHPGYADRLEELRVQLSGLDQDLADRTTRQLLATLREDGAEFYNIYKLSWSLVQRGDAEEFARAYTQVMEGLLSERSRMYYLHRLRQIVDESHPNLPAPTSHNTGEASERMAADNDLIIQAIKRVLGTMEN